MRERNTKSPKNSKQRQNKNGKEVRDDVKSDKRTPRNDRGNRDYGDVNDANYYFLDDTVKSQITNVSFNQYVGVPFNLYSPTEGGNVAVDTPSIMVFHMNPAAGTGNNTGSVTGLNLAALNTYTKLSANNAKTTQYAPQDITMLYLALGQLIALTSHIARVFGATKIYNVRNRAYPRRIITALGVNYDDLVEKFADYKTYYNSLMTVLSSIPIPNNVPYFAKCSEIYSYIYLDMEGSAMAQSYAFIPYSTWVLQEATSETGTTLKTTLVHSIGSPVKTMGQLLTILDNMIQALLQSATLNYIYSDILRLADKEGLQLLQFSTIPDDYITLPVYNPEIRKWINNAMVIQAPVAARENHTDQNDVVSDPDHNTIKYYPSFTELYAGTLYPIMNFDSGFPSDDDIVDATRLMAHVETGSDKRSSALSLPDFYITGANIYDSLNVLSLNSNVLDNTAADFSDKVAALSNFDWSPFIYVLDANGIVSNYIGDVNFFTTLDGEYLERLFDMGYQALFSMR